MSVGIFTQSLVRKAEDDGAHHDSADEWA
jgi:hypothetical protein